ncbi:MAG: class I SAM-dependent methyltransferase [Gammaproteobacteria bacterium]|nr:class I SAM-dependent methyltransferase [Gammaproteobacteria bacterium]
MTKDSMDKIVSELRNSANCIEAVDYYNKLGVNIPSTVLERGTTDFDRPYRGEDRFYKVDAYIHQYLLIHYRRNFAVFENCKFFQPDKPCLFIDFGCGPMTAGLALAKRIGKERARETVAYWGIDISARMREKAKQINAYYRLFFDANFSDSFAKSAAYGRMTVDDFLHDCIVVINFSYVLSGMTLKGGNAVRAIIEQVTKMANYASQHDCPVYIIYQNPNVGAAKHDAMHANWEKFRRALSENFAFKQEHSAHCEYGNKRRVFYSKIRVGSKLAATSGE